jgi:predicted transcriptional regulator
MVASPAVHGPATTVGELRRFFRDDHVHAALLVDKGMLIGVVERSDLAAELVDDECARPIATIDGRTIHHEATADDAIEAMKRSGKRRLAVVDDDGALLGLLCLKASGLGFCSDADVRDRRSSAGSKRAGAQAELVAIPTGRCS